jgi:hypothetical protein
MASEEYKLVNDRSGSLSSSSGEESERPIRRKGKFLFLKPYNNTLYETSILHNLSLCVIALL